MAIAYKTESSIAAFISLCIFVAPMFFSKDTCDYFFLYLAFVLCLIPTEAIIFRDNTGRNFIFNARFTIDTLEFLKSPLFIIISFYAVFISFKTCQVEGFSFSSIQENIFLQLVPIMMYLFVICKLSISFREFSLCFVGIITFFAAMNALFNLMYYASFIKDINDIYTIRLGVESIGVATGKVATTFGLTYALYSMAAFIVFYKVNFVPVKIFYIYMFIIILLALLLTQSRGSILAFFISMCIYVLTETHKLSTKKLIFSCVILISSMSGVLAYLWLANRLVDNGVRFGVWFQAIDLFLQRPLFGYGERDFFQPLLVKTDETLYHGHNILINAGLRGGIFGLLAMVLFLAMGIISSVNVHKHLKDCMPMFWLIILFVSGIFDFDIVVRSKGWEWIAFWTVIGIVLGSNSKLRSNMMPALKV